MSRQQDPKLIECLSLRIGDPGAQHDSLRPNENTLDRIGTIVHVPDLDHIAERVAVRSEGDAAQFVLRATKFCPPLSTTGKDPVRVGETPPDWSSNLRGEGPWSRGDSNPGPLPCEDRGAIQGRFELRWAASPSPQPCRPQPANLREQSVVLPA